MTDISEETITLGELEAALRRMGYTYPHFRSIFENIKMHREPEWKVGDVVKSAGGNVWMRTYADRWLAPGLGGTYPDNHLTRPLTRLVPEGE